MGRLILHWLVQSSNRTTSKSVDKVWGNSSGRCLRCSPMACISTCDDTFQTVDFTPVAEGASCSLSDALTCGVLSVLQIEC